MKINGIDFKKALLDAINGMALGLFSTLIVGVIIGQFAKWLNFDFVPICPNTQYWRWTK